MQERLYKKIAVPAIQRPTLILLDGSDGSFIGILHHKI
jgi:hypothetical protein